MAFIDVVLQAPAYGWKDAKGKVVQPSGRQILTEFFSRINVFSSKKNWISAVGWFWVLCTVPLFVLFFTQYFTWPLFALFMVYAMIVMSTHGTIWYHRYSTHRAFTFSHPIWRFITQNLVIKVIPEEMYAISHMVHHAKSDEIGDPYNARLGLLYCFFADTNHQGISKNLSEADYKKAAGLIKHTGIIANTYQQYLKWGSIANPYYTMGLWVLNWSFWYTIFFLIGGHALATCLFSAAALWVVGVRAFNYTGHGSGEVKHVDGIDFDRSNLSINQWRPGVFAGEWHNNHHLFPGSARSGFLPYQLDLAWVYIYVLSKIGMVSSYHDSKKQFLLQYESYKERSQSAPEVKKPKAELVEA
jgi:fatty-acid desaturase